MYNGGGMSLFVRPRVNADRQKCPRGMWQANAKSTYAKRTPYDKTSKGKTARYFLRVRSAKRTGGNGMSLKITSKDVGRLPHK